MRKIPVLFACLTFTSMSFGQTTVNISDADLVGGQTYNWTKDKVYLIDGLTFLEDGGVLNIEAGTVVKFTQPPPGSTSSLVICRGSKINAIGTINDPIIFTSELDDVNDPNDLGPSDVQLWAGLVILGKATTIKNGDYEVSVEGIPSTEPRGKYGAAGNDPNNFDDNDNSGELKYVSIRHTGFGLTTGSELQGLTLGGVGRGTRLSFIDIYASSDDGVELFGGTVDLKYFSVSFAEDDSYDFDENWKGKGQFLFSIQREDVADSGWEYDGSTPDDTPEYTDGTIYNFTHIGSGSTATASNPIGLNIRAGGVVKARNGIVADMKGKAIEIQDKSGNTTTDSYSRFSSGLTKVENNIFYNISTFTTLDGSSTGIIRVTSSADDATASAFATHLAATNVITDPGFASVDRGQNTMLSPLPSATGPAYSNLASYPTDVFFSVVDYKGAFPAESDRCFIGTWTTLARNNHLAAGISWVDSTEVGIEENRSFISDLKVYPNPTVNGSVSLEYHSSGQLDMHIYDTKGVLVKSAVHLPAGQNHVVLDVTSLQKGLYVVRFSNGHAIESTRIHIQ